MSENQKLTFIEHFGVLRKSFIKIILLLIVFFIPAFYFRDLLMELSLYPIIQNLPIDSKIIFTKPTEGLSTNIKLAEMTIEFNFTKGGSISVKSRSHFKFQVSGKGQL